MFILSSDLKYIMKLNFFKCAQIQIKKDAYSSLKGYIRKLRQ